MSVASECKIYENNGILRNAIDKAILSLNLTAKNIIFINISYHEDRNLNVLYSGMKHIMTLRGEGKDSSPVTFYGFEDISRLQNKPEASILNSPAVKYIKMPFEIDQLKEICSKLRPVNKRNRLLDEETKKLLTEDKDKEVQLQIRGFVHAWRNGVTYLTALLNKLSEYQSDSLAVQESINELIKYRADFISVKCASYNGIQDFVEQKFKRGKKITALPKMMQACKKSYTTMYNRLEKVLKGKGAVSALISALQKTIDNLKEVEDLLNECIKK